MQPSLTRALLVLAFLAMGTPLLNPAPAHSASITTLFASDDFGAPGGAVYFDLTTFANPIRVTGFATNTTNSGSNFGFEVFTTPGTAFGNETNPGVWTSVATGVGTGMGDDNPSPVALNNTFLLGANTSFGIALILDGPEGQADHEYTNGDGTNQNFANSDLSLALGSATNVPFTSNVLSPRVWNGTIHYEVASNTNPIPEPSTMLLFGTGVVGLMGYAWRRKRVEAEKA